MNETPTRRAVLRSGGAAFAVAFAGCQRADNDASGTMSAETARERVTTTETAHETVTTGRPNAWPAYRWKRPTETAADGLLADSSEARFYALVGDRTLAVGADGNRRWTQPRFGRLTMTVDDALLTMDGEVRGLDATTGETRWSVSIEKHVQFVAMAELHGTVYAIGRKVDLSSVRIDEEFSRLYRIEPTSGEVTTLGDLPGSPNDDWAATAAGDTLYLARDDGVVFSYDADATERWRTDLRTGEETATPHYPEGTDVEPLPKVENVTSEDLQIQFGGVSGGTLYVGVEGGLQTTYGLHIDSGETLWETRGYHVVESVSDDRVIVSGGGDVRGSRYAALDPASGGELWSRVIEPGQFSMSPGLTIGGVLYTVLDQLDPPTLLALDATTGETFAEVTFDGIGLLAPVLVDGTLVFATRKRDGGSLRATAPLDPSG